MAKTCSVCKKSYPDHLKQCPHCQAKATAPGRPAAPVDLDKSSSGEIFLDAPEADLAALNSPAARGPESSDEIVEIDWSAIEDDSSESSSVVDLAKDAYVELEAPSGEGLRPRSKGDHPSSAEIILPPEAQTAGTPPVPLAMPAQPPLASKVEVPVPPGPAPAGKPTQVRTTPRPPTQLAEPGAAAAAANVEAPSSFTLAKPATPEKAPAAPPAPPAGNWDETELIDIEHLTTGDESSVVDLGSGPHRRKDRRTDPAQQGADSSSGNLIEIGREEELIPWNEESSAVDLGSTPDAGLPASQTAGVNLHQKQEEPVEVKPEEEEAHRDEEPDDFEAADLEALRDEVDEEPAAVMRAEKPRRGVAGVVGGVIGAALATAACGALWYSGVLPEPKRGNTSNPPTAPAQMSASSSAPAVAAHEDPRTLMDRGDYARVLEAVPANDGQAPDQADRLALRGEAQWRSYLLRQRQQGQAPKEGDQSVEEAKATLTKSKTPEGTLWLGQIQEGLGNLAGARKIYEDGLKQYQDKPALARMFQTALRRIEALEDVPEQEGVDEKKLEIKGLRQGAVGRPGPGLMFVALLGEPPTADKAAAPAEELEAGDYFWEALQLARQNKYAEAIHTLDRAATVHKQRRFLRQNKSQNPKSDPAEQIFLKCCQELEAYWKLRLRLAEGGYLDTAKQRSALKAVDHLIKDAKAPKSDPAVQVVIDKLKKDKDATAQDPDVKDLGKGLDAVLQAKQKAEEQLAAVKTTLSEAKVVSDKQSDPVKGITQLVQEKKQTADALKQATDSLAALKMGNEALTATLKILENEKYITGAQPSIPKGVERLVADKKAAEAKSKDAATKVKAAEDKAKVAENQAKMLDAQVKVVTERNKVLITQLSAAQEKAKDLDAKVQSADAKLKELPLKIKAAENKARQDVVVRLEQANTKLEDAYARLKTADDTLRAVAAKLALTRVVSPEARGADLVRGAEQVARLAVQQPRAITNPPVIRPQDTGSVQPAMPMVYRNDPLLAEQYYNRGLGSYWSRRYGAAEGDFREAIRTAGPSAEDARFFYFLGLSQLGLGKTEEAQMAFREASNLERDQKPSAGAVNASLERVQGPVRRYVDSFRR